MLPSLAVYGTGWLAAALIVAALSGPSINFLLRRRHRPTPAWLNRHYQLGLAATAVAMLHTLISITRSSFPLLAEVGLVMASTAIGLVAMQAVIGAMMRTMQGSELRRARRYHRAIGPALVIAVGLHVVLNGPLPAS